ncbi:MAG: hypothetical protein J5J00_17060 [Deltaproteobacteria bacterium]|nr:hypothetical protein [Deltaproteobacteria bacterium]
MADLTPQRHNHDPDDFLRGASFQERVPMKELMERGVSFARQTFQDRYGPLKVLEIQVDFWPHLRDRMTDGSDYKVTEDVQRKFEGYLRVLQNLMDSGLKNDITFNAHIAETASAMIGCSPAAADTIQAALDSAGIDAELLVLTVRFYKGNAISHGPVVWQNGEFIDTERFQSNEPRTFLLCFDSNAVITRDTILELDEALRISGLVGQVGINLRDADSGIIKMTCTFSQLQYFTDIPKLEKIIQTVS